MILFITLLVYHYMIVLWSYFIAMRLYFILVILLNHYINIRLFAQPLGNSFLERPLPHIIKTAAFFDDPYLGLGGACSLFARPHSLQKKHFGSLLDVRSMATLFFFSSFSFLLFLLFLVFLFFSFFSFLKGWRNLTVCRRPARRRRRWLRELARHKRTGRQPQV